MPLAADLLEQAHHLAGRDKGRPKQASLKRAVSAAYYSLFHLLLDDAMRMIAPAKPEGLRNIARRSFTHKYMASVCKAIQNKGKLTKFMSDPLPLDIRLVAVVFEELQEARHQADYDITEILPRLDAQRYLKATDLAFAAWARVRNTADANVFLFAMFLGDRWKRG